MQTDTNSRVRHVGSKGSQEPQAFYEGLAPFDPDWDANFQRLVQSVDTDSGLRRNPRLRNTLEAYAAGAPQPVNYTRAAWAIQLLAKLAS